MKSSRRPSVLGRAHIARKRPPPRAVRRAPAAGSASAVGIARQTMPLRGGEGEWKPEASARELTARTLGGRGKGPVMAERGRDGTGDRATRTREALAQLIAEDGSRIAAKLDRLFAWPLASSGPEDIVQEAAARLLNSPKKFDFARGKLAKYFFGMCVKVAQEWARKAERLQKLESQEADGASLEEISDQTPVSQRASEEEVAALRRAIAKLPKPLRVVIEADLEAGGTAETGLLAAKLGISKTLLWKRRSRARRRLRELLAPLGFTSPFD